MPEFSKALQAGVGSSFKIVGTLIESPAEGQKYEIKVEDPSKHELVLMGESDK